MLNKILAICDLAFLIDLLDYRSDTDYIATVSAIKNDVSIKGATAGILICSILVCSVGLNANSPAVVIGAMLIDKKGVDEVIDLLQPDAFYKSAHQNIFESILCENQFH